MTEVDEATIILCGGPINYSNLPIGTNLSNAMIPVNGKPVVGWVLDDLLAKGINRAVLVLREEDHRLQSFLQRAYACRMDLLTVYPARQGTILQSLQAGLHRQLPSGLVRIVLGDTLISDPFSGEEDFAYIGSVEDARRWCIVLTTADGRIVDYIDKREVVDCRYQALAGYYHLRHGDHLQKCVEDSVAAGEGELSDVLRRYGAVYPIQARPVQRWYDFGHIDNLVDARRLLQPRYFNSLTINPVLNTITKISYHIDKLLDELNWYLSIPDELKVLTPRILSYKMINDHLEIVQEYYGYPTLAELYIYGELHADSWLSILRRLLRILQEFRRYPGKLSSQDVEAVYIHKTWERLNALRQQDPSWSKLLETDTVVFNGQSLRNLRVIEQTVKCRAQALAGCAPICVIHGDFCFSNILFDVNNQIVRLIDPRGSFGCRGIYGDARYDVAKLRHSVCGLYDYVLSDMFELQELTDGFRGRVFVNEAAEVVSAAFDRMLIEAGYDLNEIRFIEGLLFISMLPLHNGYLKRQHMMYLRGLSLLNEVL